MELCTLTAHELAKMLREKKTTVPEIVESVYKKIDETESDIKAYISLQKESALQKAKEVQQKFDAGEDLPPLAGIPIAIKDNICTKGVKTTCASKMLENFIPPFDATVIEKLKAQDAIIIGKTNMDEFAMGSSTENSAMQITKNPLNLEYVPGGSSGGSAATVAGNEAILALGSDTGGSIREPASFCGIVGIKPTYGTVSRYGLVAFASSFDQIGPLAKDVEDSAILLNAITGHDSKDATSADVEYPDYTKALTKGLEGLKIGIIKEHMGEGINEEVKAVILKQVEELKAKGATVEEVSIPNIWNALSIYYIITSAEASSNLSRFDGVKYGYRTKEASGLNELYEKSRSEGFGSEVKRRIMLGTYVLSSGYYDAYYNKALKARTILKEEVYKALDKYDALIGPVVPNTAFKIGEKSDNPLELYLEDICSVPINIIGVPAISVPAGKNSKGLPIGMQIIGKAFSEELLIKIAYNCEEGR